MYIYAGSAMELGTVIGSDVRTYLNLPETRIKIVKEMCE